MQKKNRQTYRLTPMEAFKDTSQYPKAADVFGLAGSPATRAVPPLGSVLLTSVRGKRDSVCV